ncbi:hypothetical protein BP1258A_1331 [Burkholderia pseudomallei 1258a]|nr:hypothetical protein BP1026B_I1657 [Burkholderia pseudomallei 1026b]EIF65813.1 hypothetical protein BP1258A_1331 [Burkholderia pseudomallei 1258a]EIF66063.1 hypothetical protein BP1026A_0789 [Burkholderia pseudomallei 1026a]EIF67923.1 hypothetical protein BP1258B_1424 [Burkholderia pseudomallei 1258b]EIF76854.1 hypothetical protein BP354E_1209 [Burkholderia pseudomallei 354e]EIF81211.1 hypothetical protein BP354A_1585 [Burkholderia pseudomallei 354a]
MQNSPERICHRLESSSGKFAIPLCQVSNTPNQF